MWERCEILQPEIHSSTNPVKHRDFTGNNANFTPCGFQGPVTAPSRMKDIQQAEFQAVQKIALNEPLYIVETQYTMNFEQFQLQNLVSSTPRQQKIF